MDPTDMVQNNVYAFTDHGSGLAIIKYDRLDGSNIYSFASIRPQSQSFSGPGLWGTVDDAGAIRGATAPEANHLLSCISAGTYVP